jgi:hypothetical protein
VHRTATTRKFYFKEYKSISQGSTLTVSSTEEERKRKGKGADGSLSYIRY